MKPKRSRTGTSSNGTAVYQPPMMTMPVRPHEEMSLEQFETATDDSIAYPQGTVGDIKNQLTRCSSAQQELTMQDDLRRFSLESIAGAFFGDFATPRFIEDTGRLLPILSQGLISIPFRPPPPLNKLPMLGFGLSMDAREELKGVIRDALRRRRVDLASGEGTNKNPGVLDSFFDLQDQQQMGAEGALDGSFSFDDDFIIDNVRPAAAAAAVAVISLSAIARTPPSLCSAALSVRR